MTVKRSAFLRPCAAGVVFATGLWLGWRGEKPSGAEAADVSAQTAAGPSGVKIAALRGASTSQTAAERERERALLDLLAPDPSRSFRGEELARLCLADQARDLPGGNDAFAYAARWAKHDPAGMNAWFMKRGELNLPTTSGARYSFAQALFDAWARKNPDEALRHAQAWEREMPKRDAVSAVLRVLLERDFEKAAAVLRENAALLAGMGSFMAHGDKVDHESNLRLLQGLPEGAARTKLLGEYMGSLTHGKGAEVEKFWNAATPETRKELIRGGFFYDPETYRERGSTIDPEAKGLNLEDFVALQREVAESGDAPEVAVRFINIHAKEWARRDFPEAARWAMTYLKGVDGMDTTAWLFGSAASVNYESVEAVWRELPEGNLKTEALKRILSQSPEEFKPRARALLEELPPAEAEKWRALPQ